MTFNNPIIPGFYPDSSICRVGEDYYLVTSTFNYFPGVPIFHSRDLVHWRQIGHCLTRESQLPLQHSSTWGGIYAPTLRHINGRFYMVTTNVTDGGHFFVHSEDPSGEWSEPVWIDALGFDPDIFVDDDGTAYFSQHNLPGPHISQWEIDLDTGKLIGEERVIWRGFEDELCEAPHIYKINGMYYLFAAEGGTHRGHMIIAARSDSPRGPFESYPKNPILTHRGVVGHPIQATGHGDLIQAHDGSWWIVFLGIRPVNWRTHHLGRETFLAPVTWEDGWPVINGGKPVQLQMDAPNLPVHSWPEEPTRDDFDKANLALQWNFIRNPKPSDWSLTERPGWLRLSCSKITLSDLVSPAFVGRRQQHFHFSASALLDFDPQSECEEAGLSLINGDNFHYEMALTLSNGARQLIVKKTVGDVSAVVAAEPIGDGPVNLQIEASPEQYSLGYKMPDGSFKSIAEGLTHLLSSEVAGGFTGVYVGMYATSNGTPSTNAAFFDWFDYLPA